MVEVIGIDRNGYPRVLGIKEGTVESVRKDLENINFNIISIEEKEETN